MAAFLVFITFGEFPEWSKGADCKSVGSAFEGPNPSLSIENRVFPEGEAFNRLKGLLWAVSTKTD